MKGQSGRFCMWTVLKHSCSLRVSINDSMQNSVTPHAVTVSSTDPSVPDNIVCTHKGPYISIVLCYMVQQASFKSTSEIFLDSDLQYQSQGQSLVLSGTL